MNISEHDGQCHSMTDCRCAFIRYIREGIIEELAYDPLMQQHLPAYNHVVRVIRHYAMKVEDEHTG